MDLGDVLFEKSRTEIIALPSFIWGLVAEKQDDALSTDLKYIINVKEGQSYTEIMSIQSLSKLTLPKHARFALLSEDKVDELFITGNDGYEKVSECIKGANSAENTDPQFFIEFAYVMMHLIQNIKFINSEFAFSVIDNIENDKYFTRQAGTLVRLYFIPNKFAFLNFIKN